MFRFASGLVVPVHDAYGGPPPLTPLRMLTAWEFNPWLIAGIVAAAALYVVALVRLRRRGDRWPVWRAVSFLGLGLGSVLYVTCGALGVYDGTLFSAHAVQHIVLMTVAPVFLGLGAPVTLFLRTWRRRPRGALLGVLHSAPVRVLHFPPVGLALYVASPFALYFTGWYEATLRNPVLHEVQHLLFLGLGVAFLWPILGLDPVPGRVPYPLRLLLVFVSMPFHAFLGIAIMGGDSLIAGDYYAAVGRTWGASPLSDQSTGGAILWASGDLVALLLVAALGVQWMRADEREAAREDRRLDRLEAARTAASVAPAGVSPRGDVGGAPPVQAERFLTATVRNQYRRF
ncbi:MAG TPA: cytochrome c oxidase assembly protein [Mycobacteriales bacterium]|nr:cytochrome c oxidase assembly protein [Mycobacteriales bacterium]